MTIETHRTKTTFKASWRQRLRYWWWLRRLDSDTREALEKFNREMDRRLIFGEDRDA